MDGESSEAFEGFYGANFDRVVRSAYLVVGAPEEALDIAQEAFARTWASWQRIRQKEDPLGFTWRVAANLSRSHLRRLIRHRRALSRLAQGQNGSMDDAPETRVTIQQALRRLPAKQRWAVVLSDHLGYGGDEAAAILGVKPSTFRVHLARARAALRGALGKEGAESLSVRREEGASE